MLVGGRATGEGVSTMTRLRLSTLGSALASAPPLSLRLRHPPSASASSSPRFARNARIKLAVQVQLVRQQEGVVAAIGLDVAVADRLVRRRSGRRRSRATGTAETASRW